MHRVLCKCWVWSQRLRPSTELVCEVVTCKSLGKIKRWQTQSKRHPLFGKKWQTEGRRTSPGQGLSWKWCFGAFQPQSCLTHMLWAWTWECAQVQIPAVIRGLRSNRGGSGSGSGGLQAYLEEGRCAPLARGRAACSDFMDAVILPAAATRS